jgi:hypothetical protein
MSRKTEKSVHDLREGFDTKEAHTRTSLAREPNSSLCGSQSWESAHEFVVKLVRARLPSQAHRAGIASRTRKPDSYVYMPLENDRLTDCQSQRNVDLTLVLLMSMFRG